MANKAMVAYCYQLTYKSMALNFGMMPNNCFFLYFHKWTNKTMIANSASINVNRCYHFYLFTKNHIRCNSTFNFR